MEWNLKKLELFKDKPELLVNGLHGLERESLRIDRQGNLSLQPHPKALGDKLTDPAVTTELTLLDGEVTGTGGVNRFTGTYEATDDGALTFGPIASTKMAGSDEAMAQESEFFAALEATEHFGFNDGNLVLSDLGNNTLAVLTEKSA